MKVFPIEGAVQNYDWGGFSYIPSLLHIENTAEQPFAELWMGTHPRGSATFVEHQQVKPLREYIERQSEAALGVPVAQRFQNELPFLFKILDVRKMLSIQTHPTKEQAEIGFQSENALGIALSDPHRNFKDDNHKPEIMVAVTDFWLLHGFKSEDAIAETLQTVEELKPLIPFFESKRIFDLYKTIMEMPPHQIDALLQPLEERLFWAVIEDKQHPDYWAKKAFEDYTIDGHFDKGIFSIYLFNIVHLKPSEAIYQAAGVPHAYLEGVNVELMSNSDNVFRGGLTPKYIDVPALLNHLYAEPIEPHILLGEHISPVESVYRTVAPDFEASKITLKVGQRYHSVPKTPDILIVLEGKIHVNTTEGGFSCDRGGIFFASAGGEYTIAPIEDTIIYRATVPMYVD